MSWLLYAGLSNAAIAAILAVPAWIVARQFRRPALAHVLWLLVLLKLVTPPMVPVRVLPWNTATEPPPVRVVVVEPKRPQPPPVAMAQPRPKREPQARTPEETKQAAFMEMLILPELKTIMPPTIAAPLADVTSIVEDTDDEPRREDSTRVIPQIAEANEGSMGLQRPTSDAKSPTTVNATVHGTKILAGVWLTGTVAWLALALRRVARFRRWLRYAEPAPASLVATVVRFSRRMGLAQSPAVRLVPGPLAPLIWAAGSRATLYFPSELLKRLNPAKRDTLLVHELAHLCRRDHWVRWLEILTLALYWWFPLAWLARRGLQRAEEECCDARVVEALPGSGRTYAEALLDAVDFLAGAPPLPVVASGITPAHSIKRRLLMILQGPPRPRLTTFGRLAVVFAALGLLPLLAVPQDKPAAPVPTSAIVAPTAPAPQTDDDPYLFDQRPTVLQSSAPRWWSCAISPDAKILAVTAGNAEQPGEITIFDFPAGTVKKIIKHGNGIRCCNFSPNGKTFAAGFFDNSIRLYDVATWKEKAVGKGHTGAVNSIAFTADGKRVVTASLDNTIKIWTVPLALEPVSLFDGRTIKVMLVPNPFVPADDKAKPFEFTPFASLNQHTNWALSAAVSKDGKTIVSGGRDNVARIWDMPEPAKDGKLVTVTKCKMTLTGHTNAVEVVAISPDGSTIATGSWDASARVWDAKAGAMKQQFPNEGSIATLAFGKNGKELAIGTDSTPGNVKRFNLDDGKLFGQHTHAQTVRGLAYHPTADELISLGEERVIKRSNLTGNGTLGFINGPAAVTAPQIVLALAYSSDGKQIAVAGDNKKISVTMLADKQTRNWDAHDDVIWALAFGKDGKTLISGSSDKTVKIWNLAEWKAGDAAPPVKVLKGHTNWVFCLAVSRDGTKLASGSYDKSVRLWDLGAAKPGETPPVKVLKAHSASVHSLAFSPDGVLLISGSGDRTVRIWTVPKGEQLGIIRGHKGAIRAVAFSPDGKTIASGSEDKTVKLWDLVPDKDGAVTGKERAELSGHGDMVGAIAFSPKGRTLLAGTWIGQVYLWDPDLAKRRLVLGGHSDAISALAFSPDGQQFASGSYDKSVRLWPPTAPPTAGVMSYKNHLDAVWSIALSKDGKWAATGSRDGGLRIFERGSDTPKFVAANAHAGGVTQVVFSPDSQTIASVGKDKIVRTWTATGSALHQFAGHTEEILKVAFHPDGKRLATAGADNDIRIWDIGPAASAKPLVKTLTGHTEAIHGLAFSPDGKLLASAGMDRSWRLWDTDKWDTKFTSGPAPNNGHVLALDFSPDGKTLAIGHSQDQEIGPDGDLIRQQFRNIMLIDTETGKAKTGMGTNAYGHPDWITGLAYTADGQTIITASRDFIIRFWSLKTNQVTRQFRAHNAGIAQLVVAPEDGFIATAGEDRVATVWSVILRTQSTRAMLTGHSGQIWFTALSNDGQYMATGGTDKRILLRDNFSGTQPFAFDGNYRAIYNVAVSPNGKMIASGHEDGKIELWDANSGKRLKTLTGHSMRVWSLAFTADNKQLYSSGGDWENKDKPGEVKHWNLDDGKVVREFSGHKGLVYNLALSRDGKTLVTASHDKTIRIWDLATGKEKKSLNAGHAVRALEFSPDGKILASCGNGDVVLTDNANPEGTVIFWDASEWKEKERFKLPPGMQVNRAKYSPDGKTVAIVGNLPASGRWTIAANGGQRRRHGHGAAGPHSHGWRATFVLGCRHVEGSQGGLPGPNPNDSGCGFRAGRSHGRDGRRRLQHDRQRAVLRCRVWQPRRRTPRPQTVVRIGRLYERWSSRERRRRGRTTGRTQDLERTGNASNEGTGRASRHHQFATFSPNKKLLATGDAKGDIYLWDIATWPPKGDVAKRDIEGTHELGSRDRIHRRRQDDGQLCRWRLGLDMGRGNRNEETDVSSLADSGICLGAVTQRQVARNRGRRLATERAGRSENLGYGHGQPRQGTAGLCAPRLERRVHTGRQQIGHRRRSIHRKDLGHDDVDRKGEIAGSGRRSGDGNLARR